MSLTIEEIDNKYLPYISGDTELVNSFISHVESLEEEKWRELDRMNYWDTWYEFDEYISNK